MTTRTTPFRLLAVLVAALLALRALPAQAADILVTETADDAGTANVSLREAVALASASDRIIVTTGAALTVNSEIVVDKPLTIDLGGQQVTATGAHRIFRVVNGVTVRLQNGTLIGSGLPVTADGGNGGVVNANATLQVEDLTLRNGNAAVAGGGLFMSGGALTADNLTLTANTALTGGGGYFTGSARPVIQRSTITGNSLTSDAAQNSQRRGAGLATTNYLVITDSTVEGNTGAHEGGGVHSTGNELIINGSVIQGNTATQEAGGVPGAGGGVWVNNATNAAFIGQTGIIGNQAGQGGGVYVNARVDLFNVTVDGNTATGGEGGGAVLVAATGQLTSTFVTYANNTAVISGQSGVRTLGGAVLFKNSLLANAGNNNCSPVGVGFTDDTGNLDSGGSCAFGGSSLSNVDPQLGGLGGGVRALNAGSPAINATANCTIPTQAINWGPIQTFGPVYSPGSVVTVDQRNAPRPGTPGTCDIGAYETPQAAVAGVELLVVKSAIVPEDQTDFATYSVRLTGQPATGTVVVIDAQPDAQLVIENEAGQVFQAGETLELTFDAFNWATPQLVQVFARQDTQIEDAIHPGLVTHNIDTGKTTDPTYAGVSITQLGSFSVRDDDQLRTVTVVGATEAESESPLTFTISLDDAQDPLEGSETVTVTYTTANGTALAEQDYIATTDTVTFVAGGPRTISATVELINDTVVETEETFQVELTQVVGARIGGTGSALCSILDDDFGSEPPPGGTLTVLPETVPTGRVGDRYEVTFTATGGVAPYLFLIGTDPDNAFPGDDWEFNEDTGVLSGTPAFVATTIFVIVALDQEGNFGGREYEVEFTLTGEPGDDTDPEVEPTPTPLSSADLQATAVAGIADQLGPPRVVIDPETEIPSVYIYSGPAVGATIINIAQAGTEYRVIGVYNPPGGGAPWYYIEYDRFPGLIPSNEGELGPDGVATVTPTPKERGWVPSEFLILAGFVPDIPILGNPFDNVSLGGTGLFGTTTHKNNLYRYPTPNSGIVFEMDEGTRFEILGRTNVDQRAIPNWLLVRLDGGQVGWIKWTPFVEIDGGLSGTALY